MFLIANLQHIYLHQEHPRMSFLQQTANLINPQMTLNMNDIVFIMVMCFQIGRLYEQRYQLFRTSNKTHYLESSSHGGDQMDQDCTQCRIIQMNEDQQQIVQTINKNVSGGQPIQLHLTEDQIISIKEQNIIKSHRQAGGADNIVKKSFTMYEPQKVQVSHITNKTPLEAKINEKQNVLLPQKQFLLEKVKLQGQKIQQKGKFELLFEKGQGNLNLIRKIQKHEIITDYILKKQMSYSHYRQLVPQKKQSFPSQNSVVQVQYYQNYQQNPPSPPIVEKKIIQLGQKSQGILNSLFEHGKFRKLYRNIIKIGQGGFGIVYEAFNMIQSKKYAIKKVFINKNSKQIQNQLNEIKILNNLSHPNMVKYNTCWLEYAQLNEHTAYQKMLESLVNKNENNLQKSKGTISIKLIQNQQDEEEIDPSEYEQSYVTSKNSGFSFARSSKQLTKKSLKKRESFEVALRQQKKNEIETSVSNNFGLLPVMYIQMELCQHSLAYYIRKRKSVDRAFAFQIMDQLINGVMYIHANRVVHRDLKPQNILFAANNGHLTVKIGDFGLALHVGSKQQGNQKFFISNNRVGTPSYIAPELYLNTVKKLSEEDLQKADVYALAVIYYEILNKFETTHERGEKISLLKQGKVVGLNQFKQEKKFIQQLIRHNRPKAKQIHGTQQWKKLNQVICKIKRRAYRQAKIEKKDSTSTAYSSNVSKNCSTISSQVDKSWIESNSHKKQKIKHRNKNKQKNQINNQDNDKQAIERIISQSEIEEYEDEIRDEEQQKQNSDDLEMELFKQNFQLIRRVSSVSSNKEKHSQDRAKSNKKVDHQDKNQKKRSQKQMHKETPKKGKKRKEIFPELGLQVDIQEEPQHENQFSSSLE